MTSLDKQSGAADDTHIVRIVRLETQMDNVTSAITSLQRTQEALQRTMEQNQLAMLAQFEALRESMKDFEWRLLNRMDRQFYWVVGLLVAHMTAITAIVVRLT